MNPVPVIVIGGYLGAGKTTFINRLLRGTDQRVTVLVNDFGSINIDAALIANVAGDTIELTNGCVCCAVGDDLADAMYRIVDSPEPPDMVVIETSGVADPRIAATYAHIDGLRTGGIVVVVDAIQIESQLRNPLIGSTVRRQSESADLLLLSKTEGLDVDPITHTLRGINTAAPIVPTGAFDISLLVSATPPPRQVGSPRHGAVHASKVEHPDITDATGALAWLSSLGNNVMRVKGIIATDGGNLLVERIGAHCSVTATDVHPTGGIVVISV